MPSNAHLLLILLCIIVFCVPGNGVYAFGAGNIPSFAYLEGKAFRHGDIEDVLGEMVKRAGGFALGALIGKGGTKFKALDVKRVYFGNWLRDYSQAVDVAGLQKLHLQTIVNLCMILGFMAHGYATNEFEVTADRLGVYLPTEHIDNPKGYPDNAQQYHPQLRGPVDPRELEIDQRTGMKNYIANEHGSWDTSKALARRTLQRCIHFGRQYHASGRKEDEYESYRLLGQALHTLEDFAAHSNFCELSLVSLGYHDVFVHVGDQVRMQAPDGRWVAPLVTGTFGSSDFIHSLLGEATDHISQASVVDLNAELDKARGKSTSSASRSGRGSSANTLRDLLFKLPGGSGGEMEREMEGVERIRAQNTKPPEEMSPQELHAVLWQVLSFRDSVMKKISVVIDKIPGLGPLMEKISDSISVFVFTTLEPFLKPIMKQATTGLMTASGEVINKTDQYEVFNNSQASDPTHSFLSKDHFNLILNEPAGNLGRIILMYTVTRIVKAWEDTSINIHQVTDDVLHCLFHPDFHDRNSAIQREMMQYMQSWVQGLGDQQSEVLRRLTKQSVRHHLNVRLGSEGQPSTAQGTFAQEAGMEVQNDLFANVPGISQAQSLLGKISSPGTSVSRPSFGSGTGQRLPGIVMAGLAGSRMPVESPQDVRRPMESQDQEYRYEEQVQGAYVERRAPQGHHGHVHHHPAAQGTASYAESQTVQMPSGETESSGYRTSAAFGYPESSSYSSYSYAPPAGPPPGFPNAIPEGGSGSGYAPAYVGGSGGYSSAPSFPDTAPGAYGDSGYGANAGGYSNGGSGYGGFAPPPGPPPGGPGFPDARYHHQNGPPSFPESRGYPPPGGDDDRMVVEGMGGEKEQVSSQSYSDSLPSYM